MIMSDFDKIAENIRSKRPVTQPYFHNKNAIGIIGVNEKKINILKEKANKHIDNIQTRDKWLEAQKRKNYINEYDRINGIVRPILKLNPQATTINGLKQRLTDLKELASKSIKGEIHDIYKRDKDTKKVATQAQTTAAPQAAPTQASIATGPRPASSPPVPRAASTTAAPRAASNVPTRGRSQTRINLQPNIAEDTDKRRGRPPKQRNN